MTSPNYKAINVSVESWKDINKLRDYIVKTRGNSNLSLHDTIAEAVKFYHKTLTNEKK